MGNKSYQVVVIGAGTAGYVAAIRCAQLGYKTACIDRWISKQGRPALGGTCLNVGCIPSKALLDTTHHYADVTRRSADFGIKTGAVTFDAAVMVARKDKIVAELTGGIAQLFKGNNIDWLQGSAQLHRGKKIRFTPHQGESEELQADHVILASGSVSTELAAAPFDGKYIVSSGEALDWENPPRRLAVIGAGAIGLEMASVWQRVGSETIIMKRRPGLLPDADPDLSRVALRTFQQQGIVFDMGVQFEAIRVHNRKVEIRYVSASGERSSAQFDRLLVAVGRSPFHAGLFTDDSGIKVNEKGFISVDAQCQTGVEGVYAIGDVVRGPMLAHKGSEEGMMVAERIAGQKPHINYHAIPMVIYTHPEIAWVGDTEASARTRGIDVKVGKFPFSASGRARAAGVTAGLIKLIANAQNDRIIGAHMMGHGASELIGQVVIAMECECCVEDVQRMCFAHPSFSEALHEAALDSDGRAIHMMSRRR